MRFPVASFLFLLATSSTDASMVAVVDTNDVQSAKCDDLAIFTGGDYYGVKMDAPGCASGTDQIGTLFPDWLPPAADSGCSLDSTGLSVDTSSGCACPALINSVLQDTVTVTCKTAGTFSCNSGAGKQAWVEITGADNIDGAKVKGGMGGGSLIFDEIGFLGTCAGAPPLDPSSGTFDDDVIGEKPKDAYDYFVNADDNSVDLGNLCNRCPAISHVELCFDCNPDVGGEPHFKTFGGEWYDFQGGCDLVMAEFPGFANGLGLDIHIRTKVQYDYSYIEVAAIKIGDDILEIGAWGLYSHNGIENAVGTGGHIPAIGDYPVEHTVLNKKTHHYKIDLGHNQSIQIKSHKDFLWVTPNIFLNSDGRGAKGMLGSWEGGVRYGRDGQTTISDPNEFGFEWQVRPEDPQIFTSLGEGPQYPTKCNMPKPEQPLTIINPSRRLGMGITADLAGKACRNVSKADHKQEMCMADVLATQDLSVAPLYE